MPPSRRILFLVCAFLLAANVFDAYWTRRLLGTYAVETNPLMRALMMRDWGAVWALKIGVPVLLASAAAYVIRHPLAPPFWRRALWYALCLLAFAYAVVVANFAYIAVRILLPSG
jgi:hypothetical protein